MRAVQVAENAVSIWFSREDIPDRRQMLTLVRRMLEREGYAPWAETEAECFTAGEDALVIARPGRAGRRAFFFEDLEALLGGASCCAGGDGSALYLSGGGYILTLAPEQVRPGLYEFGADCALPAQWEEHAREQGLCLLPENAAADLRRYFLT